MIGKNLTKLQNKAFGDEGEEVAAAYLAMTGYHIVARNWRTGKQEVDIIAEDEEYLIFVEVKTRSTGVFGSPKDAVDKTKQKHLIEAANRYAEEHEMEKDIRFDVIGIIMNDKEPQIEHITEAFTAQW